MEEHFPITALLPMKEKSERVPEKKHAPFRWRTPLLQDHGDTGKKQIYFENHRQH